MGDSFMAFFILGDFGFDDNDIIKDSFVAFSNIGDSEFLLNMTLWEIIHYFSFHYRRFRI
jgi:hypothetical protein